MLPHTARMYRDFQAANPETKFFNEELLHQRERDNANSVECLADIFQALEVIQGVKFLGAEVIKDERSFPPSMAARDVEIHRLDLAVIDLHLEMGDEEKDITLFIFLPKLIDGLFYVMNGSTFYPIFQLVDRGTYTTKRNLTLKTLLMPLMMRRDTADSRICVQSGETLSGRIFTLDLFRHRVNVLKYFFAEFGLAGTIEYFSGNEIFLADAGDMGEIDAEEPHYALEINRSGGLVVAAKKSWVDENPAYRTSLLLSFADALHSTHRRFIEAEDSDTYFLRKLGAVFTTNTNALEDKAKRILVSLKRILDARTRKNLAHVATEDREDVFALIRWMAANFDELCAIDGLDVRNKRIRMLEYILHPLLIRLSVSTYRLLNSRRPSLAGLESMFKMFMAADSSSAGSQRRLQTNFLLRSLSSNELLRFGNFANGYLLIPRLRVTTRGPQSIAGDGGSSKDVPLQHRGQHPSFIGRIGLNAASASDPGMTGSFTPFCRTDAQFII